MHALDAQHRGILTFNFDDNPQPWEVRRTARADPKPWLLSGSQLPSSRAGSCIWSYSVLWRTSGVG